MADEETKTDTKMPDSLGETIVTPAGKLDADQYSADDLDGVTESLFGSGNMAYASLQASQTDAALADNEAQINSENDETPNSEADDGGNTPIAEEPAGQPRATADDQLGKGNGTTNTDRPSDQVIDLDIGAALDLLNPDETENSANDNSEETNWTESIVEDGGGLFGDIIDGINPVPGAVQ